VGIEPRLGPPIRPTLRADISRPFAPIIHRSLHYARVAPHPGLTLAVDRGDGGAAAETLSYTHTPPCCRRAQVLSLHTEGEFFT
jgi:hypothetical protein